MYKRQVGNKSSDPLAVMDSIVPQGFKMLQSKELKGFTKDRLAILDATSLAAEEAQKDIARALKDAGGLKEIMASDAKILLEGGTITDSLNSFTT